MGSSEPRVLGDILDDNRRRRPDRCALVDSRTRSRLTWGELDDRVNRLANGLVAMGVRPGDRVALVSENSVQCAELYFAVGRIGAIGCGLNYRLQPAQLERHVREASPRVAFFQERYAALLAEATRDCAVVAVPIESRIGAPSYEELIAAADARRPATAPQPDDPLMITYSSGTTGLPKGVVASHRNRVAAAFDTCVRTEGYAETDVVLNSAPFCAGVSGQAQLGAAALAGAATVMDVLDPATWIDTLERERVTALVTTRARLLPVFASLAREKRTPDFSSLRRVTLGGQPHGFEDVRRIVVFFGLRSCAKMYGTAETSTCGTRLLDAEVAAGLAPGASRRARQRLESVGKPFPGTEITIVNEAGDEAACGELGEVLIRGDVVSSEYWNDPALTSAAFVDGWFHTQDVGFLDRDGHLHLRGRRDYMINTGGLQVAPVEVEQALQEHPAVLRAAVLGVPDERWGQAVAAVVELRSAAEAGDSLEGELRSFCRERLAGYQVPKRWHVVDRLPTDEQGRIDLKALREAYAA